jgi:hypothetical protein
MDAIFDDYVIRDLKADLKSCYETRTFALRRGDDLFAENALLRERLRSVNEAVRNLASAPSLTELAEATSGYEAILASALHLKPNGEPVARTIPVSTETMAVFLAAARIVLEGTPPTPALREGNGR